MNVLLANGGVLISLHFSLYSSMSRVEVTSGLLWISGYIIRWCVVSFSSARLLSYLWLPFFTRFGRLTAVQESTIPEILDVANVVVASPTASGKTEAVIAPLAERHILEQWEDLAVLYIVPTRALANDTLVRIEGPLQDIGITAALKHGDKPNLPKVLPNLLITTPESLDSIICRNPKALSTLRAIVLDEVHLLDNTYRGDQLRILLT